MTCLRSTSIADAGALAPRDLPDCVAALVQGGVRWIQLRAKRLSDRDLFVAGEGCLRAAEGSGAILWINDRADMARMLDAPGLHVGQEDLDPASARRVVGTDVWLGCSTHNADQAKSAASDQNVDVVAVGPVFATRSKVNPDPVVGLDLVTTARTLTEKPLVAIGGVDASRAVQALDAGADSVAVISAICREENLEAAARRFLRHLSG